MAKETPSQLSGEAGEVARLLGTVAIVGFPNVGKSTLINRLTGSRAAVVHETPGVTRDRKELICEWGGQEFLLVDTGGVDVADPSPITRGIAEQAQVAIADADLVLFVVDAQTGITPGDEEIAGILRHSRKPVILIANKIDDPAQDANALEFHRLGLGDPVPLSGLHGHGTGDLLDTIVDLLPGGGRAPVGEEAIRVAILGRPNVGKSSLLNRCSAASACSSPTSRARRATRSTRCSSTTTASSCSSTRRGCGASAASGRASSTTRSCARSRRPSGPTWRSCSWTQARGSWSRTSRWPRRPVGRTARR